MICSSFWRDADFRKIPEMDRSVHSEAYQLIDMIELIEYSVKTYLIVSAPL